MEKHVMQYQTVHFNLNGKDVERTVDVRASLTDMLRNDFRMTSVKKGCEVGECGASPLPYRPALPAASSVQSAQPWASPPIRPS